MNDGASQVVGAAPSAAVLIAYFLFLRQRTRQNPLYTVYAVSVRTRTAWVHAVMAQGKDILAVQTLRNSTMACTFLASTSVLLAMGTLSLMGKGDTFAEALRLEPTHASASALPLLSILIDLLAAFFSFLVAMRSYNHVGYMISMPVTVEGGSATPAQAAALLNHAFAFYAFGMRAYYLLIPLLFWLFTPWLMLLTTCALVLVMHRIDRAAPPDPPARSDG